jgi:hypothetical protein
MLRAQAHPPAAAFVARLAAKARDLAEASTEARQDEHRWRKPSLLWPLFAAKTHGDR